MTVRQFTLIKEYILLKGDRQTYCNMYNDNPHLEFGACHAYLHPSTGQANINCDPSKSDFDTVVVQDWNSTQIYYNIRISANEQELVFDPPEGKGKFEQLYRFVQEHT